MGSVARASVSVAHDASSVFAKSRRAATRTGATDPVTSSRGMRAPDPSKVLPGLVSVESRTDAVE